MPSQIVIAVAVLVFREGRVLAMRRAPRRVGAGLWETLSGRVEAGEQPVDAARRETREETGLEIDLDPRPVMAYAARRGDDPLVVIVYRARSNAGEVERSDEHDEHRWLTPEEFAATSTLRPLVDAVRQAAEIGDR